MEEYGHRGTTHRVRHTSHFPCVGPSSRRGRGGTSSGHESVGDVGGSRTGQEGLVPRKSTHVTVPVLSPSDTRSPVSSKSSSSRTDRSNCDRGGCLEVTSADPGRRGDTSTDLSVTNPPTRWNDDRRPRGTYHCEPVEGRTGDTSTPD